MYDIYFKKNLLLYPKIIKIKIINFVQKNY